MSIALALDILLIAIIAYFAWHGWRNGLIVGILEILAVIVSLFMANLISNVYCTEFTGMLSPFATGIVDQAVLDVTSDDAAENDELVILLEGADKTDVYKVSFAAFRQCGLTERPADNLAQAVAETHTEITPHMADEMTELLCHRLAYLALLAIVFVLILIVFSVIGNVLDLYFAFPGMENLNKATGSVAGLIKGIMIVMLIAILFSYSGMLLGEERLNKTVILELFMNSNILANFLGI